ncbi:sulfate transporter family-domain-containing protein [Globomyces pollinis-pini]|nr:sulfate transporter family-domain-containing protein [Globomyces pollinis-pini]
MNSESSPLLPTETTQFPDPSLIDAAPSPSANTHNSQDLYRNFKIRLRYYVPIVGWLPRYKLEYLQGDIMAGLTVAFLIIPQSLSYAQALVNVPPLIGLFSAFIPQFIYSCLGTSRQLAIGPEALVSILVGSSIREFTQWRDTPIPTDSLNGLENLPLSPVQNIQATALLCLMVGLFTFLLGFFRLGFLDSVLSRALLRGFVLAVAFVVMIDMSETLLGLVPVVGQCKDGAVYFFNYAMEENTETLSPFQKLLSIISNLENLHVLTSILSFISLSFLLGIKLLKRVYSHVKWLQLIPEILVLVVTSTAATYIFRWDCSGVAILNTVDSGLSDDVIRYPLPTIPKVKHLMLSAILISVIGFVESIVVAKTYASKHQYAVSPNRELVAMGVGNIVSSLFGCFPAFGSLGRSAVNDAAGSKTQLSGFITGLVVYITAMWLLPLFKYLPKAVCSSIIIFAALRLIELEDIFFICQLHAWKDLSLLCLTFFTTMFVSIETGTLLSVGVSLLLVVKHTTTTRIALLGQTNVLDSETGQYKPKFKSLSEEGPIHRIEGALIIRFEEGMFFGNVGQLKERLKRIEVHGDLGIHPGEEPRIGPSMSQDSYNVDNNSGFLPPSNHQNLYGVVFDMKAVSEIDASATQTVLEIVEEYQKRNILVCFVKLRDGCRDSFNRSGLVQLVGPHSFYSKINDAVQRIAHHRSSRSVNSADFSPMDRDRLMRNTSLPFRRSPQNSSPREEITSFEDFTD